MTRGRLVPGSTTSGEVRRDPRRRYPARGRPTQVRALMEGRERLRPVPSINLLMMVPGGARPVILQGTYL